MMPGIEILSQTDITAMPTWVGVVIGICVALFTILCCIRMINCIPHPSGAEVVSIVCVGIFALLGITVFAKPTGRYEYTAYVDESVDMVEFYERYDNVTFDGEIFTFEDKERS